LSPKSVLVVKIDTLFVTAKKFEKKLDFFVRKAAAGNSERWKFPSLLNVLKRKM